MIIDPKIPIMLPEARDRDAWVCKCGNTPFGDGFYPSGRIGRKIEPTKGWGGLYVCNGCGAVIDYDTLKIVGYGTPPCKLAEAETPPR